MAFALLMAAGQFSPGPDMVLLTRTALERGAKVGCVMALGIATGLVLHGSLVVFGLVFMLEEGLLWGRVLKWAASGYLIYLAVMIFRASYRSEVEMFEGAGKRQGSLWRAWLKGFFCNVLNPKVALFLGTVMLPFLKVGGSLGDSRLGWLLVGIVVMEGALLWCLWVVALQQGWVRELYRRIWRWLDRLFAFCLLVLTGVMLFGGV